MIRPPRCRRLAIAEALSSPTASGRLNCWTAGAEGCTEAILHAHGFATADIAELVRAGFASMTAERVVAGSRKMEVARVRITGAGQRVLGKIRNQDAST